MKLAVWISRLLLGAVFIISGVSKMVDPIGFAIKISAYLAAWDLTGFFAPGLILMGGCILSTFEFVTGILLATGSLRRSSALGALLLMCVMLPLTAYIALANPVDDCGCFGDFLIISNVATFLKNVVLFALALFLVRYNRRAKPLIAPWIQWVEITAAILYIIVLALIGYHEQPLLDFRAYPVGEPLTATDEAEALYVYSRNGIEQTFADSELPDEDSGWEFKEVRAVRPASAKLLTLLDPATGLDVTDSVLAPKSGQMLLLLPFPSEAGAAGSYTANELQAAMERSYGPGSFAAITIADSAAVDRALDVMMATYPVYYADQKAIMAVARGSMAVVYLRDGIVAWKRTLSSINLDKLADGDPAEIYATDGPKWFRRITAGYLIANLLIYMFGLLPRLFRLKRRKQANSPKKSN